MRRSSIKPKAPPRRPERQVEYTPTPRRPAVGGGLLAQAMAMNAEEPVRRAIASLMKTPDRKDQRIRDSARGEDCYIRLTGVCNHNPETTVWCHLPGIDGDRGMALKAIDPCGAYGCSACHDVLDMRLPLPAWLTRQQVLLDFMFGHMRSLVRLRQKGLL